MPVYSFVCPICGARFDERLSFSENLEQVTCPNGHRHVRRVYSVPSIVYKGKGFYTTDSRKKTSKGGSSD